MDLSEQAQQDEMDKRRMRLECLRLSTSQAGGSKPEVVVDRAKKYADFVIDGNTETKEENSDG